MDKKELRIGVDEVGRGCIAGPVVAVAAIFLKKFDTSFLEDSKKLSATRRKAAANRLKSQQNNGFLMARGVASVKEINKMNIRIATFLAMRRAIKKLISQDNFPKGEIHIYVDGADTIPGIDWKQTAIIKGDDKIDEIKAASIMAKTFRDWLMTTVYHLHYSQYHWDENKGYCTKDHKEAIKNCGLTPLHRNFERFLKKIGVKYDQ